MSAFSQKFQKKNSGTIVSSQNKPKNKPTGWEDDDDEPGPSIRTESKEFKSINNPIPLVVKSFNFLKFFSLKVLVNNNHSKYVPSNNTKEEKFNDEPLNLSLSSRIIFTSDFDILTGEELSAKNIEYEMKIVEDIIQPQGAKIKPMEETLLEFGKVCESMQVQLIGSVLLASLSYDINWKSIIKCLYVIEFLCKKLPNYARYFKYHRKIIENLEFQADPGQIKQIQAVYDMVLERLRDQSTPKNINPNANIANIDLLMQKYKEQEHLNSKPNNLLEDSDQEHSNKSEPKKEKPSSNFAFISSQNQKENSAKNFQKPSTNNNNPNISTPIINNMNFNGFNNNNDNNNNNHSSNNINNKAILNIDPNLASIDFSAPIKEQPKPFIPNYNLNTQIKPTISPKNPNYNILDSIQQPLYGGFISINKPFVYQPPTQGISMNLMMTNNNNNLKDNLKSKEDNPKESAFDFVNDLVKIKK